ncbi:hypothetical protein ACOMHN_049614 [Nucella lapillus]
MENAQFSGISGTAMIQAVVFIEDAYKYQSINHKVDEDCLRLYRRYHSTVVHVFRWVVIFTLHILAFFEGPSSLTWTSDIRYHGNRLQSPCWLIESIELVCILVLALDSGVRVYLMGRYYFWQHKWDVGAVVLLLFYIMDWGVSACMGCTEVVRVRRIVRPYFILLNSSLMKKTVNCLRRSLPEVFNVLIMLGMHLYIFTLFAMLLFPTTEESATQPANGSTPHWTKSGVLSDSSVTELPIVVSSSIEGRQYFSSMLNSFMSLLVLLTTANNPDVTMPAYSQNRLYALFFMLFLIVGLYCFWNMLTAVIYNQFRGYFLNSMQSSLNRRRLGVRAAFEVLCRKRRMLQQTMTEPTLSSGVGGYVIKSVVEQAQLPHPVRDTLVEKVKPSLEKVHSATDFHNIFLTLDMQTTPPLEVPVRWFEHPVARRVQRVIVHKYFSFFGIFVAACNVIIISVELATEFAVSFDHGTSDLRVANFAFANYYVVEQLLKLWANGLYRYVHFKFNIFEALITVALVTMQVISSVLLDLVSNMKAFAGVLIVIYYVFAILGMELFQDVIKFHNITDSNQTFECGSYQQLQYWSNNFDDFASSLMVLWDVMVVNNWMVFLDAYRTATSAWAYVYFVAWWMISVIIVVNLFTAIIMENFIMKWDRSQQVTTTREEAFSQPLSLNTVHDMFRGLLQEPADNELLKALCHHRHLELER